MSSALSTAILEDLWITEVGDEENQREEAFGREVSMFPASGSLRIRSENTYAITKPKTHAWNSAPLLHDEKSPSDGSWSSPL